MLREQQITARRPRARQHQERRARTALIVTLGGALLLAGCARRSLGVGVAGSAPTLRPPVAAPPPAMSAPSTAGTVLRYTVRVEDEPTHLRVEMCPQNFVLQRIVPPYPGAQKALREARSFNEDGGEAVVASDAGGLPPLSAATCASYSLDLGKSGAEPSSLQGSGADLLASPDEWLWVPEPRPPGLRLALQFQLPEGLFAAFPWPQRDAEWAPSATAFAWKSAGAFTHRAPRQLQVAGAELTLAELGPGFEHPGDVEHWVAEGARAASSLFGHFPLPHTLVILVPGDRPGPAFGMALRGGGPAVVIFLDRQANATSLAADWTAAHEFLHLGVPRLPPEDAWLFEGLATYYAEVTRARAGLIRPAQAYQHLLAGFARGQSQGGQRVLREESAQMRENHSFYRVYWAGAALSLLVDVEARKSGGPSLDSALRAFAGCCAASERDWNAAQVLARLDASLGAPRFARLTAAWLDRREFPDLSTTLRALGVSRGRHGEASLGPAPYAGLRDAIMRGASQLPAGEVSEPSANGQP